jgi:putative Mg2+ transporter-C (MgtC) family protein
MASLSSALIVVVSLVLYEQLTNTAGDPTTDPLRAIQGLAQAIGFVAAGAIFFARGQVHNLTSAANIWLAAGLGIAAGAGEYFLVGVALALGVLILTGVRVVERWLPGSDKRTENGGD